MRQSSRPPSESARPVRTDGVPESPFGVKGLLFQGTRTYFEGIERWDALLAELRPALREFMAQPFISGVYYEALIIPELIRAEARVCDLDRTEYLTRRTEWQASRDLRGVYRVVIRVAPPEMTVSRLVMLMTQMFNFGDPLVTKVGPGHLDIDIAGVPEKLTPWLRQCLKLYGELCLRMAGSKNIRVRRRPSQRDGEALGHPTATLAFSILWGE